MGPLQSLVVHLIRLGLPLNLPHPLALTVVYLLGSCRTNEGVDDGYHSVITSVLVWHFVECLLKIKYNGICLVILIDVIGNVLGCNEQMCVTSSPAEKPILAIKQDVVFIEKVMF